MAHLQLVAARSSQPLARAQARPVHGGHRRSAPEVDPGVPTLADALERWFHEVGRHLRGWRTIYSRVQQWCRHPLGIRHLDAVTPVDIAAWRNACQQAGRAPSTINNHLQLISGVYQLAVSEWGLTGLVNPTRGVRRPPARIGRERILGRDEESHLLVACRATGRRWLAPLVVLALETAMRRGELLALRWQNVNPATRLAHLPVTKSGRRRSVPLSSRAWLTLEELPRTDDRGFAVSEAQVGWMWRRATTEAGLQDLRFHDLRHTAVTRLFERGLSLQQVMVISGHSSATMVHRYAHLSAAELVPVLG